MLQTRRGFLFACIVFADERRTVRVATAIDPALESASRGLELGIEEARRGAELLGFRLEAISRADDTRPRVPTLIASGSGAAIALSRDIVFHVLPPAAVLRAALARWLETHRADRDTPRVTAWHHSLERYGAEQLNDRFERRFNRRMDAEAWSAWVAVKIVVETSLRQQGSGARGQGSDGFFQLRFDGHKGVPLIFDRTTRYLQQPLYIVTGSGDAERVVAEV